ncbi:MAG: 4-hydroxybenzoate octaprenyltransferase [Pseudomonadota bacterium]
MSEATTNRVADALPNSWVYSLLPQSVWPYAQLARWDRPIGWWLLLWPCWWSLALASRAVFDGARQAEAVDAGWVAIFTPSITGHVWALVLPSFFAMLIGAIAMRGAGCTYNDIVDVKIDAMVARTASRPIPSGRASRKSAAVFLVIQALVGFACLLTVAHMFTAYGPNWFAFLLGVASLAVVACYPFAKRVTNWPQFVLGLAFSWGALMGWASIYGELSAAPLILYAGSILWVIGYDTIYAHQDREDDALIGVKSTARLFGTRTRLALTLLYSVALACFAVSFGLAGAGVFAFVGLLIGGGQMIWQIRTLDIDDADLCLRLFKSNSQFGWIIFGGLLVDIAV